MVKIPTRLEDLLPIAAFERVLDALNRPELSQMVREAVSKVGLQEMNPLEQVQDAWQQARSWLESVAKKGERVSSQIINASGRLMLSDDIRLPMASTTSLAWAQSAVSYHDRVQCLSRASDVVQRCLGQQHHVWLADPGIGLLTVFRSLEVNRVFVAKSDSIRVPGIGEVHSLLRASGVEVTEVGPANGASLDDWSAAMHETTQAAIFLVSPNGLPLEAVDSHRRGLIQWAASHGNILIDLRVDGSADDRLCVTYGFPSVRQCIDHDKHLVLLPCEFLLGGPKGLLCLSEGEISEQIGVTARLLGSELDCASINANLMALQIARLEDEIDRGLVGSLIINPENLSNRSARMAMQISGTGAVNNAIVVDSHHPLAASPWDRYTLSNPVVNLEIQGDAFKLAEKMKDVRKEHPAILLGIRNGQCYIDLRFVDPAEDHQIVAAVQSISAA
jgi:hypothetical protein